MAFIQKELDIARAPKDVWAALCDFANAERLFPGVLTDSRADGDARVVTFANGMELRERIVDRNDQTMRLAYTASGGNVTHHHASFQVFPEGDSSRVVWIVEFLPNAIAPGMESLMNAGVAAMKATLER